VGEEADMSSTTDQCGTNFISVAEADYITTVLHFPVGKFDICLTSLVCLLILYCIFCVETDTPAQC